MQILVSALLPLIIKYAINRKARNSGFWNERSQPGHNAQLAILLPHLDLAMAQLHLCRSIPCEPTKVLYIKQKRA
jgi:hypothetical protein